jgi:branched-chain amino acid transport system substrate-binding protein
MADGIGLGRLDRRAFMARAGSGGVVLASGGLLGACGGVKQEASSTGTSIRVGYVSPQTGPAAGFGEADDWLLGKVRDAVKSGLDIGGKHYDVEFIVKDSQSNPQRAAAVANDLISGSKVDLMLASSTPESVNPVSDACEAAGVPCISTVVPWQAWYFGRGAKEGDNAAFKFVYHFSFGVETFAQTYISQWGQVPTNKKVGAFWPNDSDGNAIRAALGPMLEEAGFTIVDPGAFENGTNDFSAQIAKYKAAKCDIFNSFALPPDFATFWKQASQQGFKPKIPQIAKTGLFPSQVEGLGKIGHGLSSGALWHPTYPYSSSLTGMSSQEIGDSYSTETGRQWSQILGTGMALFDAGIAALKGTADPKSRQGLADTIGKLKVDTPVGTLDWTKGPNKNVVTNPLPGCQWVPSKSGKFPLDNILTEHATDENIPVQAKLKPYPSFQ